uniref:Unplaced genomic scaffold supercont1.14, whole genome shotgun sequence n=1 Tax=Cryptococcus bacillisporus CA1280 TaxID=1296109 RepID=A0A0D0UC46_CRYGA|nr:hypothetical protein I312_04853 [Cryptococcus bacillisporus CA1280]
MHRRGMDSNPSISHPHQDASLHPLPLAVFHVVPLHTLAHLPAIPRNPLPGSPTPLKVPPHTRVWPPQCQCPDLVLRHLLLVDLDQYLDKEEPRSLACQGKVQLQSSQRVSHTTRITLLEVMVVRRHLKDARDHHHWTSHHLFILKGTLQKRTGLPSLSSHPLPIVTRLENHCIDLVPYLPTRKVQRL